MAPAEQTELISRIRYEMTKIDAEVSRGVEMLLLVKTDGAWRIAAQAWDAEGPSKPIPPHLAGRAEEA